MQPTIRRHAGDKMLTTKHQKSGIQNQGNIQGLRSSSSKDKDEVEDKGVQDFRELCRAITSFYWLMSK